MYRPLTGWLGDIFRAKFHLAPNTIMTCLFTAEHRTGPIGANRGDARAGKANGRAALLFHRVAVDIAIDGQEADHPVGQDALAETAGLAQHRVERGEQCVA